MFLGTISGWIIKMLKYILLQTSQKPCLSETSTMLVHTWAYLDWPSICITKRAWWIQALCAFHPSTRYGISSHSCS